MSMGFELRLALMLECKVCKQFIMSEKQTATVATVILVGNAAYAVCPSCSQEVEDHKDRNYRRRVNTFVKRARENLA